MKSKGGSSLYEVLKCASRPSGEPASAPEPAPASSPAESGPSTTLQDRLAAYKAAKLASVAPVPAPSETAVVVLEAPPETPKPSILLTPAPAPVPAPLIPAKTFSTPTPQSVATPVPRGPGERAFRVTYNTAVFVGLVTVGLLFIAYAVGMQAGKSKAAEVAATEPAPPPVPSPKPLEKQAPPPPPAPRVYAVHLAEWPIRTSQENLKAMAAAEEMKKALSKAGLGLAEIMKIQRANEQRLALYLGRFTNLGSSEAKNKLALVQKVKVDKALPFAKAEFEEVPRP